MSTLDSNLDSAEKALIDSLCRRESTMIDTTRRLASTNSGSFNRAGIENVNKKLCSMFTTISEKHTIKPLNTISLIRDNGQSCDVETEPMHVFSIRPEAPLQLLCSGHSDTVFPRDSAFQSTWIEGDRLRGPGVADMKGGLVVLYEAIRAIEASPYAESVGFTIAISPDEEIGSTVSAPILTELAEKADVGLNYAPYVEDGALKSTCKNSGNFTVTASGKSVNVDPEFFAGRNALTAVARLAILLEDLSDEAQGISVNINKISGGDAIDVVPGTGVCRLNIQVESESQIPYIDDAIQSLMKRVEEQSKCELSLHGGFNQAPKSADKKQQTLFGLATQCGSDMGLDTCFKTAGGCCESNNLASAGLMNIDTLGVRGGAIHSDQEFAFIDSFVERAQFSALLIARLCTKGII